MKKIETLVQDIYALLDEEAHAEGEESHVAQYADEMSLHFAKALASRGHERDAEKLYASEYGDECLRRLWYKVNHPELGDKLEPHTRFKFMYGDMLETSVLTLAKAAGHTVEREQERIEVGPPGLTTGRIDAVIDGHLVDVKSMSVYAFNKYKEDGGVNKDNDSWGYRWQLALYQYELGLTTTPYFLGIDKQNGHIALLPVTDLPTAKEVEARRLGAWGAVYTPDADGHVPYPPRGFDPVPEGKSGNEKLAVACSYCAFKNDCWPGLRTFLYSRGPVFLTTVKKEPNVYEVTDGTTKV